jgi:hypothetical protein
MHPRPSARIRSQAGPRLLSPADLLLRRRSLVLATVGIVLLYVASCAWRGFWGPPTLRLESLLGSTDSLDQQLLAIGGSLAKLHGLHPPPACPWCGPRVAGVLIAARAVGRVDVVEFVPVADFRTRYRKRLTYVILTAVETALRAGDIKAGTILHLGMEDSDVYYHEAEEGPSSPVASEIRRLTREHPNLFWLHWNPTLVDRSEGFIGERVVPIPHYEALYEATSVPPIASDLLVSMAAAPVAGRSHDSDGTRNEGAGAAQVAPEFISQWEYKEPAVVWRGSTTGFAADYSNSDRARTVSAFNAREHRQLSTSQAPVGSARDPHPAVATDVKFSGAVQGVPLSPEMVGRAMAPDQMLEYRVQLDIDGNANAWESFRWKLLGGVTVVKVDPRRFIQWYYPLLRHGQHVWLVPPPTAAEVAGTAGAVPRVVTDSVLLAAGDNVTSSVSVGGPLSEDVPFGARLAYHAQLFARRHLVPAKVVESIFDIIAGLETYRKRRSWTIQGGPTT